MSLNPEQVFIIGILASVLVAIINEAAKRQLEVNLKRGWLTVALFAVCIPLALWIQPTALPGLPGITGDAAIDFPILAGWLGSCAVALSTLVGTSTAIYNILLKRILDSLAAQLPQA